MPVHKIDVHAHYLPDFYRDALIDAGQDRPDGMPGLPAWSEEEAIAVMDQLGVRTAMLSISSPGVHFGDDAAARSLARRVNEAGAELAHRRPTRFGVFAITPLPDIEGAIAEVRHALDELRMDGVGVETHHGDAYLGDGRLDPFYAELNSRAAVAFIHPTSPSCAGCGAPALGYPRPMLEFMFETTRSVTQMILNGVIERYPDIRFIVPHAGAALPVLASRVEALLPMISKGGPPVDVKGAMRRMYFDLAGVPLPELLIALREIVAVDRLLYGSDWPFTPTQGCRTLTHKLDTTPLLDAQERQAAMLCNALKLFPRLVHDQDRAC